MNYCYVLLSDRDRNFYIGSTGDLRARLREHHAGRVRSTAYRRPLRLVYDEACLSVQEAQQRKRYLKSGRGGRHLKQRIGSWPRTISRSLESTRSERSGVVRGWLSGLSRDKLERH